MDFPTSFHLAIGHNKTHLNDTTHKWSFAHDPTLVSTLLTHQNSLAKTPPHCLGEDKNCVEREQKLNEVRHVLERVREGEDDALQGLIMIDAIQCLGIEYIFQKEIDAILKRQYEISTVHGYCGDNLYEAALGFRLLRQQGYNVSADVFYKFKNKEGKFKPEVSGDIKGLLGLYEAAQLSIEGEEEMVLDEAKEFTSLLLNACVPCLPSHEARFVLKSLKHPFRKSLSPFRAKNLLTNLQGIIYEWIHVLQQVEKIDANLVQSIHQKELVQISKWWTDLGLAKELKLARDQPLKWHMWSMKVLPDPSLSEERLDLTKPISLVYIIDDIFDVYGTLDELSLFTEAVNRWDFADVYRLPKYMMSCLRAVFDTTNKIAGKFLELHGWDPIHTLRKTWANLCNAFLVEAKWFASGQMPKAEEYLKNGIVSSGVHVVLVHLFFLLGQGMTKECLDLVNNNDNIPGIIYFPAMILRLWDDLGSAKDENQDGHDGSYLEYYMKEHPEISLENAREHIVHMISDAWKCLNKECLFPNPFPAPFTKACLNAARMVPLMYNYDHNHNLPGLEEHVNSLLNTSFST